MSFVTIVTVSPGGILSRTGDPTIACTVPTASGYIRGLMDFYRCPPPPGGLFGPPEIEHSRFSFIHRVYFHQCSVFRYLYNRLEAVQLYLPCPAPQVDDFRESLYCRLNEALITQLHGSYGIDRPGNTHIIVEIDLP